MSKILLHKKNHCFDIICKMLKSYRKVILLIIHVFVSKNIQNFSTQKKTTAWTILVDMNKI